MHHQSTGQIGPNPYTSRTHLPQFLCHSTRNILTMWAASRRPANRQCVEIKTQWKNNICLNLNKLNYCHFSFFQKLKLKFYKYLFNFKFNFWIYYQTNRRGNSVGPGPGTHHGPGHRTSIQCFEMLWTFLFYFSNLLVLSVPNDYNCQLEYNQW